MSATRPATAVRVGTGRLAEALDQDIRRLVVEGVASGHVAVAVGDEAGHFSAVRNDEVTIVTTSRIMVAGVGTARGIVVTIKTPTAADAGELEVGPVATVGAAQNILIGGAVRALRGAGDIVRRGGVVTV